MGEQTKAVVREGTEVLVGAAVVSVLFSLATLNEFVTTDPGVPLARPQLGDILGALLIGLIVGSVGYFIDSRGAGLRVHSTKRHARLIPLSMAAGVALGVVILGQVAVLAQFDSGLQQRYERFASEPLLNPLLRAFSAAVIEEVLFRYLGMTAVALVVTRQLGKPHLAYRVALISSAAIFGVLHLSSFSVVGLVIVLFNTLGGLLFGWLFWHWGLTHALLAHFTAGLVIQSFGPRLFG